MADLKNSVVPFDKIVSDESSGEDVHQQIQQLKTIAGKKSRQRSKSSKKLFDNMYHWSVEMVGSWLESKGFGEYSKDFAKHQIDGFTLCHLQEKELIYALGIPVGHAKKIFLFLQDLKEKASQDQVTETSTSRGEESISINWLHTRAANSVYKFVFSFLYLVVVLLATAFTMSVVHDRVPDMTRYPPLPDIFLDNIQLIPWAFSCAEYIICAMIAIYFLVLLFHRHRMVILRRTNVIAGSVFLLRCFTMYVTSLSVPGAHLQCDQKVGSSLEEKLVHAWKIVLNGGLSINGVRTCGDYMFSGHTVVLTLLNFFILEYTPHNWFGLSILTWSLNFTGMFFILAAHEHYSIDVFIAFFISSRLFLYYHSLANATTLKGTAQERNRSYFPLFSYLEEDTRGPIANSYEWPWAFLVKLWKNFQEQQNADNAKKKK